MVKSKALAIIAVAPYMRGIWTPFFGETELFLGAGTKP
jgi:hypothetical protein